VRLDPWAEAALGRVAWRDIAPLEGHEPWAVLLVEGHWIVF
jgi:hypothetical protein